MATRISRRRSKTYTPRAPRRKMVWVRSLDTFTTAPGETSEIDLLTAFEAEFGAQLIGATVVRILGEISSESTLATGFNTNLYTGIIVAEQGSDEQRPSPFDDPHARWMYWRKAHHLRRDTSTQGDFTARQTFQAIDVRAMRKIDELNQSLFLRVGATQSHNVSIGLSVLVKLH